MGLYLGLDKNFVSADRSPHVRESGFRTPEISACGIRNAGNFSCRIRNRGLCHLEHGFRSPDPTNNWNPESKFHWQRIRNPVPGVRNPRCGIQNPKTVLYSLSWGEIGLCICDHRNDVLLGVGISFNHCCVFSLQFAILTELSRTSDAFSLNYGSRLTNSSSIFEDERFRLHLAPPRD